eukprot:5900241-Prymnesium_polylepis.1
MGVGPCSPGERLSVGGVRRDLLEVGNVAGDLDRCLALEAAGDEGEAQELIAVLRAVEGCGAKVRARARARARVEGGVRAMAKVRAGVRARATVGVIEWHGRGAGQSRSCTPSKPPYE